MMNSENDREGWSWGKSIFVKISILGIGFVVVLWAGWPHPKDRHDHRAALFPIPYQAAKIQTSPSLSIGEPGAVMAASLPFSKGQEEKGNPPVVASTLLVDLNLGSRLEFETLPGIGVVLADRILAYRSRYGFFKHVQDLEKVEGIGAKRFKRLKPFVTVQSNTAAQAS
jgi:competence ComEA-like helix-hairpin-helix protein